LFDRNLPLDTIMEYPVWEMPADGLSDAGLAATARNQ